jgi:hypothetical protein
VISLEPPSFQFVTTLWTCGLPEAFPEASKDLIFGRYPDGAAITRVSLAAGAALQWSAIRLADFHLWRLSLIKLPKPRAFKPWMKRM